MEIITNNIWLIIGTITMIAALVINYNLLDANGGIKND